MIGFKIGRMKGRFFDSKKVIDATTRAERKVLSRFGSFVRRSARSSIRKRKKASRPGKPPSSHHGGLRRFIYFAYEPTRKNVVIGPALFAGKRRSGDGAPLGGKTTPEVLEHGGRVRIVEYQREFTPRGRHLVRHVWGRDPDAWHRLGNKRLWHKRGQPLRIRRQRTRTISIRPRPFMGPAFEKEKPKLPAMWQDSIRA